MATKTEIANLALGHCAVGQQIADLDVDATDTARTLRRFYDIALESVLSDFDWPFATKTVALALVAEEPDTEWGYSYRYPSDCVNLRRVLSGIRTDNRQTRAPYKMSRDAAGLLILTDEEDAVVEYTERLTSTNFYTANFVLALSYYLAVLAAPELTAGDEFKLGEKAGRMYEHMLGKAVTHSFNEEQPDEEPDAEHIRARG